MAALNRQEPDRLAIWEFVIDPRMATAIPVTRPSGTRRSVVQRRF